MEENRDIFDEARIFLKKRRLERMGIHADIRVVKISPEELETAHSQEAKDSA